MEDIEFRTDVPPFREFDTKTKKVRVRLHRGQEQVMMSKRRIIAALAGAQSGKTEVEVEWLKREIELRGAGDYLAGSATFPLMEFKLIPAFEKVFCEQLWQYKDEKGSIIAAPLGDWRYRGKQWVSRDEKVKVFFFSGTNPSGAESAEAKAAVLDEGGQKEFLRDTWEAINRRLSVNQGRCLIGTTVYLVGGWLKTEVYDRWKKGDPNYDVIQWPSTMNPAFPPEEYERQRQLLPPWKFDMFWRGLYSKPAGLVYDCFDTNTCVIPRRELPKEWSVYVGHDFGAVNTAALWYAQDPSTGFFYLYRTYKKTGSLTDHIADFKELSKGENIVRRVGGSHQEQEIRDGYSQAGWSIAEPNIRSVEAQINKVYALNKQNRIYVFSDLHDYIDEKSSFSRELDSNYEPTEKLSNEASFHYMASERYILSDFAPHLSTERRNVIEVIRPKAKRSSLDDFYGRRYA